MENLCKRANSQAIVTGLLWFLALSVSTENMAQRIPADPQDSLLLVQFQQEIQSHNWPQIWNFSTPVEEWIGVRLESGNIKF